MKKYTTQERLLDISKKLKDGETFSAEDISLIYEVSLRTAQRDLSENLSKYLEPNILVRNPSTLKWSLSLKNEILQNEDELFLDLLLEQSKQIDTSFSDKTLKLVNKFRTSIHASNMFTKLNLEDISSIKTQMSKIDEYVLNRNILECVYKNKKRKIAPLRLANFDGLWYLVIRDLKDKK